MGDYPRNITTSVRQLGAIAQRLKWCQYCIGNDNKKAIRAITQHRNRGKNMEAFFKDFETELGLVEEI